MKTRKTLNADQSVIDAIQQGYEVHNASRPLYGMNTWTGDFLSGVFYSALQIGDPDYNWQRERNAQLDAVQVLLATEQEVVDEMTAYYRSEYPDIEFDPSEPGTRKDLVTSWFNTGRHLGES